MRAAGLSALLPNFEPFAILPRDDAAPYDQVMEYMWTDRDIRKIHHSQNLPCLVVLASTVTQTLNENTISTLVKRETGYLSTMSSDLLYCTRE